ncbi:hypothetical protein EYZ11_007581 [Aspergillus tanneri]|uniref:FAD/NAD(P)-binding domain-containing protein n=1 Tax=Aspergillus tanneri TaxID=1220188 RepID=A0A4S3JEW8_9EURO|nr:uncharacterized protein ATNIH1004_010591 [Aspergillus tanneri]KAA8643816.1 hypothetical protein ATNIH1004_010591 [Aspergillus tanneri]THC92938.1 hypothetical protein EYZ11_007581 [Aspergillus tanneri]
MATPLRNIVVVGGSYVGKTAAQELARRMPDTHRVLLVEPHSHFHHLFTFPRFAVIPGHEHKAFIPYTGIFANTGLHHAVVQARALSVQSHQVHLDREWQGSKNLPFDYLVVATGTRLIPPGGMTRDDKLSSVDYLQKHQAYVRRSRSILIAGGGAVGVQMATDLKERYPDKEITVAQSRAQLMPGFHEELHRLVKDRFDELGIKFITGARVVIPETGFPTNGQSFKVSLTNGTQLTTDFVILATGQIPNNTLLRDLPSTSTSESVINPDNGYIRIKPTMQFLDPQYSHLFAVGDIADTGLRKAARPGAAQAAVVAQNIQAMIEGRSPHEVFPRMPAAIHLTLGMKYNVIFRNPNVDEGQTGPSVLKQDNGQEDMNVEAFWQRLGVNITNTKEYHL